MADILLKKQKPNNDKLLSYGFQKKDGLYLYHRNMVDGQMRITVSVMSDGGVCATVTDNASDEEYILHRVAHASGSFVGRVRSEYEAILDDIEKSCFDSEIFKCEQTKQIIAYIRDTYGDELEYLWQKFPDNAVARRKDNRKWYAAILTVARRKLGFDSDEIAEIVDLRVKPEDMEATVDNIRYFPGYHMNKKHWITVCLDGTVAFDDICEKLDASYILAKKMI